LALLKRRQAADVATDAGCGRCTGTADAVSDEQVFQEVGVGRFEGMVMGGR